jgi:hypothetical protein
MNMSRHAWLVLLIALLLPVRGALAGAGLLCHTGSASSHAHAVAPGEHVHSHSGTVSHDTASMQHVHDGASQALPGAGTCTWCSAVCASPMVPTGESAASLVPPPHLQLFPPVVLPALSYLTLGLERPPRSI